MKSTIRTLVTALGCALSALAGAHIVEQRQQDSIIKTKRIETESLILKDSKGSVRAVMDVTEEGAFVKFVGEGSTRASLGIDKDGNAMVFLRGSDNEATTLLQRPGRGMVLAAFEQKDMPVLTLKSENGVSSLEMRDLDGKLRAWLSLDKQRMAWLGLASEKGGQMMRLAGLKEAAVMQILDSDSNERIALGVGEDGSAGIVVSDEDKVDRLLLRTRPAGEAHISVFDQKGKEMWFAGTDSKGESRVTSSAEKSK